jgi:hypothetical protein
MSHLILATNDLAADHLRGAGKANVVIGFNLRFVFGPLPSEEQLVMGLERRSAKHNNKGDHWLDDVRAGWLRNFGAPDIGFFELCEKFDSIELWVDPRPNDQLVLVWLLDFLRPYREITSKLSLVQTDDMIAKYRAEALAKWKLPVARVAEGHLALASRAWGDFRAPTPEGFFDLLMKDAMMLPRLRSALIAMLEELPDRLTGLGASEMRMLEWIEEGCTAPREIFWAAEGRDVLDDQEAGELLDELAQCPVPPIFGLGDPPFDMSEEARHHRYRKAKVALTELGRAIVHGEDDLWRHNPIGRWWGGTQLTNDRLWRWDAETRSLVAP